MWEPHTIDRKFGTAEPEPRMTEQNRNFRNLLRNLLRNPLFQNFNQLAKY